MQFIREIFSKNTYQFINLSTEVFLAIVILVSSFLYPETTHASLFSSIFNSVVGDQVYAKTLDIKDTQNSQNMFTLRAVTNPSLAYSEDRTVLASENSLLAEIGPSGTIRELDDAVNNTQISLYTVRSGDTISQIAKMFNVSVNTIIWANSLGANPVIKEGQNLIILPISGVRHTVKKGETIKSIVARYKADLNEVLLDNDLTISSTLKDGDTIIIPDAEPTEVRPIIKNGVKTTAKLHDANGPSYPGYYSRPIIGGRKSQGLHGYNGVDLAASVGTPIYASAGGIVIASMSNGGWNGGYGNYVIISHTNGTQTLYSHNSVNLVTVGQRVEQGDMIAKVGMTGKTTGPHVHFEIRGAKNPF